MVKVQKIEPSEELPVYVPVRGKSLLPWRSSRVTSDAEVVFDSRQGKRGRWEGEVRGEAGRKTSCSWSVNASPTGKFLATGSK